MLEAKFILKNPKKVQESNQLCNIYCLNNVLKIQNFMKKRNFLDNHLDNHLIFKKNL